MPAEKKDSAATNRLLDLLRSQQAGQSTTEGNASGTVDAKSAKPQPADSAPPPASPATNISSSIVPDADQNNSKADVSQPVSSAEIMAELGAVGQEPEPDPGSPPVADALPEVPAVSTDEKPVTDQVPSEAPKPIAESAEPTTPDTAAIDTLRIDSTNFQIHKAVKPANKLNELPFEFANWAQGTRRKITVQCLTNSVRIMKMRAMGKRNLVESMETFELPYLVGDEKITHSEELLGHILAMLNAKLWKKDTLFSMYSSGINTHTKIFKAPPVKGKEFAELINWSAKKNLPFSSEKITIDHQVLESEKGELKKNIIIGVGNSEAIQHLIGVYRKAKFNLQNVTTIPYLDWQSFKHCYPDRLHSCVAVVHINQAKTTITMVKSGRLEFNREMSIGVQDYLKALVQRVVVGNDAIRITDEMAADYLFRYGIPKDTDQDIPESGISLYKLSIFLRPVIERMTGELNRSLNYFKKQVADVECQEIYLTGPGAAIPNLVEIIETQLGRTTEHFNLLRQGDFEFSDGLAVDYQQIPNFALNFSLALQGANGINLLPVERKQHFRYRFYNKLAIFLAAILLPIYIILGYFSYLEVGLLTENVITMQQQWKKLSEQSQEYFIMLDDLEYMGDYWSYLKNDQVNSENQLKLLRLLSSEIPDNIKITSLVFRPASSQEDGKPIQQDAHVDRIALSGFVHAHAGIADIQLTNFIMRLESLNVFTNIEREVQGTPSSDDSRLFFTLKLGIGI